MMINNSGEFDKPPYEGQLIEESEKSERELFSGVFVKLNKQLPVIIRERGLSENQVDLVKEKVTEVLKERDHEIARWEESFLGGKKMSERDIDHVSLMLTEEVIESVTSVKEESPEVGIEDTGVSLAKLDESDLSKLEVYKKSVDAREFETTIDVRKKFMQKVLNSLQTKVIADTTPEMKDDIDFGELERDVRKFVATDVFPGPKISEGQVYAYTEKWNNVLNGDIDFNLGSYANIVAAKIFEQLRGGKTLEEFKKRMVK